MTFPHRMKYTGKKPEHLYSKGTYSNMFPIALANWMNTKNIPARFVEGRIKSQAGLNVSERDATEVFNGKQPEDLHFDFEKPYDEYSHLHSEEEYAKLTKMDVVISDPIFPERQLMALENKLTVVPDSTTRMNPVTHQAPEIVIRPNSIANACSALFVRMSEATKDRLRVKFKELKLKSIRDWTNEAEILRNYPSIILFVESLLTEMEEHQKTFMLHAIWATHGQSWLPRQFGYDMLIWTDHAVLTLMYLEAKNSEMDADEKSRRGKKTDKMGRSRRTMVRITQMYSELLSGSDYNYSRSFKDISFNEQTDKENSIPGSRLLVHLGTEPFNNLRIPYSDIFQFIPEEGFEHFSPERRSDQTANLIYILHVKFGHSMEEIYEKMGIVQH